METIYIYHTNDIHSHFQTWPRIRNYVKAAKENRPGQTFVFDSGDFIDRFHPFTEATAGKGNMRFLQEAGYDAVTVGNNEGITLSHDELNRLYVDVGFSCVVANLFHKNGSRPSWAHPYRLFHTNSGTTIALTGVTVPYANFYEPLNWLVKDPFIALAEVLPVVREKADIVIVLSHLGLSDDEQIAREFPGVDLIIGGHTHHILQNGKRINETLLTCTGKYGRFLGEIVIRFNPESKKVVDQRARLIPVENLPPSPDEADFAKKLMQEGKRRLTVPVASLPEPLPASWFSESALTRLLCEGLTEWCRADCSFINAGILLDGLGPGMVTEYEIHQICPHPINPCVVHIDGSRFREVLLQTESDRYMHLELKGFGFRGKVFGKIVYDNIQIEGRGAASTIKINDEELLPDKVYRVATLDIFAFARFYPEMTRSEKEFYLPETIRDILKWKLQQMFPYKSRE